MKYNIFKFASVLMMLFVSLPLLADDDLEEPAYPGEEAPIDNWMFILVFAAVAVGVYFLYKQNRKAIV